MRHPKPKRSDVATAEQAAALALALRPAEAAKALAISESQLWQWIKHNEIAVTRLGRVTLIETAELRAFLARNRAQQVA